TIPVTAIRVHDASGTRPIATLQPEDFPYASDMRTGPHEVVRVSTGESSHTTVTVPANAAIVDARMFGAGMLSVVSYHAGTLVVLAGGGRVNLDGVQAATFVQQLNGRFSAVDSTFERLRARGNTTAMLFERCRSKQIEVTSYSGPIVYDNGTFDPGLARFQ